MRTDPVSANPEERLSLQRALDAHAGLALFTELLAIPSPSGHERWMGRFLMERLMSWGYAPEVDPAGNVLVRVPGADSTAPTCCLAAHMDEIAMVVTQVEADGTLRIDRTGGLYPWKLGETPVDVLTEQGRIRGVVSLGSGHSRHALEGCPSWDGARILTGLSAQRLADRGVRVGSPVVPCRDVCGPFLLGSEEQPTVAAWTFDNRLGVTVVLQMLRRLKEEALAPRCPLLVAFTVEEEVGCHGAKALAQRERPEVFVAVDGSPLVPEAPLVLDGRPGIRTKDRSAIYDQELFNDICDLSASAGVELQPVIYDRAASDASAVYAIGAAPRAACFGYVRDSSHGYEVTPLVTFDYLLTTICAFVTAWKG